MRAGTAATIGLGVGGLSALGTYILFNPRLRRDMMEAENAAEAAGILGAQMRQDAAETRQQMMRRMRRRWLQQKVKATGRHAKRAAQSMAAGAEEAMANGG